MISRILRKEWPSWSQLGVWLVGCALYSGGYYLMDYSFAKEIAIGMIFIVGSQICDSVSLK